MIIAAVSALLVVLGTRPFGLDEPGSIAVTAVLVVQAVALAAVAFLKGRFVMGVIALFVPIWGWSRPSAWPSRTRRGPGRCRGVRAGRMARAKERFHGDRRSPTLADRLVALTTGLSGSEPPVKAPPDDRR